MFRYSELVAARKRLAIWMRQMVIRWDIEIFLLVNKRQRIRSSEDKHDWATHSFGALT